MSELNFDSRPMRDYLLEMAKYWMDPNGDGDFSDGVDGYRCDVGKGPPHDWWKELRRELKQVRGDFLLLGEVWDNVETIYGYFDYEYDMQFDYPTYYAILELFNKEQKSDLKTTLKAEKTRFPIQAQLLRFLNNHDNDRILSVVENNQQRNKLAALILLTLPGTPLIYYGEEVGMTGVNPPDEAIRTPMEWKMVAEQRQDPKSLLNWYSQLIRLRDLYPALDARNDREASTYQGLRTTRGYLYAYARHVEGEDPFIVLVNVSDLPVERYKLRTSDSFLAPGRYTVTDLLRNGPDGECSKLQVGPKGRIAGYRPRLQLEPQSGYLLKLERLSESGGR